MTVGNPAIKKSVQDKMDALKIFEDARKLLNAQGQMFCPICNGDDLCDTSGRYECKNLACKGRTARVSRKAWSRYTFSVTSKTLLSRKKNYPAFITAALLKIKDRYKLIPVKTIQKRCGIIRKSEASEILELIHRAMQPARIQQSHITHEKYFIDIIRRVCGTKFKILMAIHLEPIDYYLTKTGRKRPRYFISKKILLAYYLEEEPTNRFLETYFIPRRGNFCVIDADFQYNDFHSALSPTGFTKNSFVAPPMSITYHYEGLRKAINNEKNLLEKALRVNRPRKLGYFLCEYMFFRNFELKNGQGSAPCAQDLYAELVRPRLHELPDDARPKLGKGLLPPKTP
jgi:hypothetical protein